MTRWCAHLLLALQLSRLAAPMADWQPEVFSLDVGETVTLLSTICFLPPTRTHQIFPSAFCSTLILLMPARLVTVTLVTSQTNHGSFTLQSTTTGTPPYLLVSSQAPIPKASMLLTCFHLFASQIHVSSSHRNLRCPHVVLYTNLHLSRSVS